MAEQTFGVELSIFDKQNTKMHRHREIELIYVLDGIAELTIRDQTWILHKDDVAVINSNILLIGQMQNIFWPVL